MIFLSLSRTISQPVAAAALMMAIACPSPSQAQQAASPITIAQLSPTLLPVETPYTLGGGDRIRITVFEVPEYSGEIQIPPGGTLYLPLIGSVSVRGLTQEQAAETISARYSRFLKRPLITVSLLSPRPINIVVAGEVNRAGSYTVGLQGGAGDNPGVQFPTILRAIELAQGVTLSADVRRVQLRRRQANTISIDLQEIVESGSSRQDITLRDGDSIFVPTTTTVNLAETRQLATANFAADRNSPRTVTVGGEVTRPGSYVVIGGATTGVGTPGNTTGLPTVSRAIQLAGGFTSLADIRNVSIRRPTKAGREQVINVDLFQLLRAGDVNQDTIVQEGDSIFIPTAATTNLAETRQLATSNFAADPTTPRTVTVLGEVNRPGSYVVIGGSTADVGSGTTNTTGLPTVSRAIQLAGGITQLADIRNVVIRRPSKTGTEQFVSVNLFQLLQTGDVSQDTLVQEGDSIIIPTATEVNPAEVTQLALTNFSPATIQVSVVGEVEEPGVVQVLPSTSLNQALLTAGGFNDSRAKRDTVELIRLNPNGTVTRRNVKLDFAQGINEQTNPALRNNDIIVVSRSSLTRNVDNANLVVSPLGGLLGILRFFGLGF